MSSSMSNFNYEVFMWPPLAGDFTYLSSSNAGIGGYMGNLGETSDSAFSKSNSSSPIRDPFVKSGKTRSLPFKLSCLKQPFTKLSILTERNSQTSSGVVPEQSRCSNSMTSGLIMHSIALPEEIEPPAQEAIEVDESPQQSTGYTFSDRILIVLSFLFLMVTFPFSLGFSLKIVREYERSVIFRLGKFLSVRKAGLILTLPGVDKCTFFDIRSKVYSVCDQQIPTRDNCSVNVDCAVSYRIENVEKTMVNVANWEMSTQFVICAVLRTVLASKSSGEIMTSNGIELCEAIKENIQDSIRNWGVKVEDVVLKTISLDAQVKVNLGGNAEKFHEVKAKFRSAISDTGPFLQLVCPGSPDVLEGNSATIAILLPESLMERIQTMKLDTGAEVAEK